MHAGPSVFWLVQSLLVTGILCFGASIAARFTAREDFPQTLLFLLASYMSMKITLVRDGLYWGAASVLYVWPMFFLLWAIFLIMREPLRKKDIALAAVLFFIASASSEPFSLYAFAFNLSCRVFVLLSGSRQSQAGNELSEPEHSSSGGIA